MSFCKASRIHSYDEMRCMFPGSGKRADGSLLEQ